MNRLIELFLSALPTPRVLLAVVPLALLYGAAVSFLIARLKTARRMRTAYTRKIFHFAIFTMAGVVHLLWRLPGVTAFGMVVTLLVLYAVRRGEEHPLYEALARPGDAPHRTLFVLLPLITTALGGIATNIFFARFAFVGYLVCGWGDAVGELVGSRWGRTTYRVPSLAGVQAERSVEGSVAVFVVSSLAAAIGLSAGGYSFNTAVAAGVLCGLAGTLVEAFSTHGVDNFTTQVVAAGVATLILG